MSLRKDYMGRRIKTRSNYRLDSVQLQRLIEAIKADDNRPETWRNRLVGHLSQAVLMMLEDTKRMLEENVAASPKAAGGRR